MWALAILYLASLRPVTHVPDVCITAAEVRGSKLVPHVICTDRRVETNWGVRAIMTSGHSKSRRPLPEMVVGLSCSVPPSPNLLKPPLIPCTQCNNWLCGRYLCKMRHYSF
jgi:hypothetical protein